MASCGDDPVEPVVALAPTAAPLPTYTPYPTYTPLPTQTPLPTYTPLPTQTLIATPTLTPSSISANTPTPTARPTWTNTPTQKPTSTPTPTDTLANWTCEELLPEILELNEESVAEDSRRAKVLKVYDVEETERSKDRVDCSALAKTSQGSDNLRLNFHIEQDRDSDKFIGYSLVIVDTPTATATPTPTPTNTPIPTATPTATATPTLTPEPTETPIPATPTALPPLQDPDISSIWGEIELFSLLYALNERPIKTTSKYVGQNVTVRGPLYFVYKNIVGLVWDYAHGESIERTFWVQCEIESVEQEHIQLLARLATLVDVDPPPIVHVQGRIPRLNVGDGGLTLVFDLKECEVTAIGSQILNTK